MKKMKMRTCFLLMIDLPCFCFYSCFCVALDSCFVGSCPCSCCGVCWTSFGPYFDFCFGSCSSCGSCCSSTTRTLTSCASLKEAPMTETCPLSTSLTSQKEEDRHKVGHSDSDLKQQTKRKKKSWMIVSFAFCLFTAFSWFLTRLVADRPLSRSRLSSWEREDWCRK